LPQDASGLRPSRSPLLTRQFALWRMRAGAAPRAPCWEGEPPPDPLQVTLAA